MVVVVQVGGVRVRVDKRFVAVPVAMWFTHRIGGTMGVLMVFVMDVQVLVVHPLVLMFVFVALVQVQPNAERH